MQGPRPSYVVVVAHALLLSLICSLPHWVALCKDDGDYTPFAVSPAVSALTFDETHAYAPPARSFMVSGKISAETDNFEHRNMSAGIPFIPAAILGGMGWALGSLGRAFIAADCIFPALLFLLLYALTGSSISQPYLRLLIAWSSVIVPFGLLNSFWLGTDAMIAPLEITRTPQPEISFLVLITAAALLGHSVHKRSWSWAIAAGVASGAVVYSYYFYALAWGIALGLILGLGIIWKWRALWTQTALALALMIFLAAPYLSATLQGKAQGGQTYLLGRMGIYSHRPDLLPLLGAVLMTIALLIFGREFCRKQPVNCVLAILVTASIYGMNVQVLSGYDTQSWHFWKRLALPVSFFLIVTKLASAAEESPLRNTRRLRLASQLLIVVLIAGTAARLTRAGMLVATAHRSTNPDIALLEWVRSHLPRGQVIGTVDPELILLIPSLTSDYTYVPSGLRSLTSTDEIVSRYFEIACLVGLSPAEVAHAAALPNHLGRSTEVLQVLGLSYTGDLSVYSQFVNRYRQFYSNCQNPGWRLDYLILPANFEVNSLKRRLSAAQIVYRNSSYLLLSLGRGDADAHSAVNHRNGKS